MKTIALLPLLLLLSSIPHAVADTETGQPPSPPILPVFSDASVTIPYAELKSLWELARTAAEKDETDKPAPPLDWSVDHARYTLDLGAGSAAGSTDIRRPSLEASYRVRTLAEGWHLVPLLGGEARLEHQEIQTIPNGSSARVVWHEDRYCLLTEQPGTEDIRLRFALPASLDWSQRGAGFKLVTSPATTHSLEIKGKPGRQQARIDGLHPSSTEENGPTLFHLPVCGGTFAVTLDIPRAEDPLTPSAWDVQSQALVHYAEGRLRYRCRVDARADSGSGVSMDLTLPPNASHIAVEGEDLANWRPGPRQGDHRSVQVDWQTRDVLDRTLLVVYETPQSPLASEWSLRAPASGHEDAESSTLFVIPAVNGLQLEGDGLVGSVQSRRLPQWMHELLAQNDFMTAEAAAALTLTTTWLPRLQTAQATVSAASFETRLVRDGSILVQAEYHIQHQAPLSWQVKLPASEQILTCQIDQQPARPVQRGDNEMEFLLGSPGKDGTTVRFCYAANTTALDPVSGQIALQLPRTDLFIHRLDWLLTIPETYKTTAIEGNVEIAAAARTGPANGKKPAAPAPASDRAIRLTKELCRGEQPAVEIYYRKRGLQD